MRSERIASLSSIAVNVCAVLGVQMPAPTQEETKDPSIGPDVELWNRGSITQEYEGNYYRHTSCRLWEKEVAIDWTASTSEPGPAMSAPARTRELFSTKYWPHIAAPTDRFQLCVAGRDSTGATILERWVFSDRAVDGASVPNLTTKSSVQVWTLPLRTRVDSVLQLPKSSPRGMIRGLIPSLKSPDQVFVYFDASRELALIDLNSRTTTTVASPKSVPGALAVPALTDYWGTFRSMDHRERGYCYVFTSDYRPNRKHPSGILAIIDSNRDGSVDESVLVSDAQWRSDGWGKSSNIVPSDRGFRLPRSRH